MSIQQRIRRRNWKSNNPQLKLYIVWCNQAEALKPLAIYLIPWHDLRNPLEIFSIELASQELLHSHHGISHQYCTTIRQHVNIMYIHIHGHSNSVTICEFSIKLLLVNVCGKHHNGISQSSVHKKLLVWLVCDCFNRVS